MTTFQQVTLGNVLTLQRGFDITKTEQTDGDIPIVSSSGISSYHNVWKIKGPALIIGRKGTLGTVHFIKSHCWPHDTTLWVKDFKGNDPRFLKYFLQTLKLESFDVGAANPTLNRNHIHKLRVIFPKRLDTQKRIAAILSTYDEAIECNQRRIALLERLAEDMYREWFVRLRFPNHENVKIDKGVPQGWQLVKIERAFHFSGGGTPSKDVERFWRGGGVNWFTPSDITGAEGIFLENSGEQCTEEGLDHSSARMFPAYSVMLTSRATIGAIGINRTPACTNQGFITCIPNSRYPLPFLYHWIKLAKPHFELLAGGATFAELTKGTFKRIEILTPPEELVADFARIETPLFDAIENYLRVNQGLAQIRDRLVPRLVSGKLPIENLDIQFPPSMDEMQSGLAEVRYA